MAKPVRVSTCLTARRKTLHVRPMRYHVALLQGLLFAASGTAAHADGFVAERVFPLGGACYGRVYDQAHLDRHRGQVVAAMFLSGSSRTLVADRRLADRIEPELALTLRVEFADGDIAQGGIGCTEENGRIARCGNSASCGGDFAVEALSDGTLRVRNDDANGPGTPTSAAAGHGFSPDGGCPPAVAAGRFIPPDAENRTFVLRRLPMADCPSNASEP